ncbi:MAG: DegT/DnrJ/EryC1/StrS family aminotransferase, partial [Polyangia bacterium]
MRRAAPAAVERDKADRDKGQGPGPVPTQDLGRHNLALADELRAAAARVLASGRYILGGAASGASEVHAFEQELADALRVSHAVGCSSGSDALLAMLMAVGVGPGHEVVTTPFSFFATAGAIARLGAVPRFADIEPATLNLDEDAAAARLGPRTRAVLTVHLFGRAAPTRGLAAACAARGIPLLEDGAQAIGAVDSEGRTVGTMGLGAALSFFPSKNLGGFGDGGMVVTNDGAFAESIRLLRTHGARSKSDHIMVGGNFRLDELQAALLRVKVPHLAAWTAARRRLAALYETALREAGTPLVLPPPDPGCVWNQFVVRVPAAERDALQAHLAAQQIATAIYYPRPLHLQSCFASLGYQRGDCPIAEQAASEV